MADIFVEVDEVMKQERLEKLWQRYGGFLIGFLAVIILGTGANAGYKSWKISRNAEQTSLLLNVMDKTNYSAQDLLAITPDLDTKLQNIVELQTAGLLLENNDSEGAEKIYSALFESKKTDPVIKSLAAYMLVHTSTTMDLDAKLSQLDSIISDKKSPWRFHALLDSALLLASEKSDYTKARTQLAIILKSKTTPQSLKQKAQSIDILYALKEKI